MNKRLGFNHHIIEQEFLSLKYLLFVEDLLSIAFNNCTNYRRYGRKCKYSHDIDFQKLKKSGLYKFELKAKGNCKNSDKCKWSHQIPKQLYRQKTAASAASPSYTIYSQEDTLLKFGCQ